MYTSRISFDLYRDGFARDPKRDFNEILQGHDSISYIIYVVNISNEHGHNFINSH